MPRKVLKLSLAIFLVVGLSACGPGWSTSYSGKDDASNMILVQLTNHGKVVAGFCGPGRDILEAYAISLRPIQRVYTDDEISMIQTVDDKGLSKNYPEIKTKGTISFNESYSKVTINVNVLKDGVLVPFGGNGTHRVNPDASDF